MFIEREQRVFHKYRPRTTLQQISPFWRPPRKWPSKQESESTTFSSSLIKNPPSWKSTAERLQNRQKFRRNSQRITTMSTFRCDSYSTWLKPKKCLGFQRQAVDWSFLRICSHPGGTGNLEFLHISEVGWKVWDIRSVNLNECHGFFSCLLKKNLSRERGQRKTNWKGLREPESWEKRCFCYIRHIYNFLSSDGSDTGNVEA